MKIKYDPSLTRQDPALTERKPITGRAAIRKAKKIAKIPLSSKNRDYPRAAESRDNPTGNTLRLPYGPRSSKPHVRKAVKKALRKHEENLAKEAQENGSK